MLIKEEIQISSVLPILPPSSLPLSNSPSSPSTFESDTDVEKRWDLEIETRMSLDLNLFICLACSGSKYSSKDRLNVVSHIKSKHVPNFAGFICQMCAKIFNKVDNFERHMRQAHNVIPVHQSLEQKIEEESIVDFSS